MSVTTAGLTAGRRAAQFAQGCCNENPQYVPTAAGENVRYVVPHQIDPETLTEEKIMLQMRVTQPMEEPVNIEIRDGDNLIAKKRERYARPGEMASITLKGRDYDKVRQAEKLEVRIVLK